MWILVALGISASTLTHPLIYLDKFHGEVACQKAAQLYRPDCHVNHDLPCGHQLVFCIPAKIQLVPGAE